MLSVVSLNYKENISFILNNLTLELRCIYICQYVPSPFQSILESFLGSLKYFLKIAEIKESF